MLSPKKQQEAASHLSPLFRDCRENCREGILEKNLSWMGCVCVCVDVRIYTRRLWIRRSRRTSEVTGTCLKSQKPSECVCSFLRSYLHAAVRLCCTIIFRCRLLYLNRSTDLIFDSPKHELHHLPTQQKTCHFVK